MLVKKLSLLEEEQRKVDEETMNRTQKGRISNALESAYAVTEGILKQETVFNIILWRL